MLKNHFKTLDPEALLAHGQHMQVVSDAVHAVMQAQGMADGSCKTICHDVVEVGPDGVARTKTVCETVCGKIA